MWNGEKEKKDKVTISSQFFFYCENKIFISLAKKIWFWIDSPIDSNQGEDFGSNKNTSETEK